ncbi:ARM repeat-containing protein [Ascobolus immersus RN42]|uniref:ARM repeat-containing protein n=1 Tax=Ascobolus immersus RN42 TaxID=1160509 RepID=A0A3N4ISW2_ASCIM|nr:ARM repeat-containing protein [Ascobolus immersus RN42]
MSFTLGLNDRALDEGSLRGPMSPELGGFAFQAKFPLTSSSPHTSPDLRGSLQRRFTTGTESSSNSSPSVGRYEGSAFQQLQSNTEISKAQLLEKHRQEQEQLAEKKRRILAEVQALEAQEARKEQEIQALTGPTSGGHLLGRSEPATPPELRESAYHASVLSNMATPPSMSRRDITQQLMTPPSDDILVVSHGVPKSLPGTRRNSDENEENLTIHATTARQRGSMRNSVNLGTISRPTASQISMAKDSVIGPGQVNTTDFLFGDEENHARKPAQQATSPDVKSYLQMNANDDRFPILVSRDTSGLLSASSAALDLAMSQSETQSIASWSAVGRQRQAHQSLSASGFAYSPSAGLASRAHSYLPESQVGTRRYERNSFGDYRLPRSDAEAAPFGMVSSGLQAGMPKLQSSYSTSDLPTVHNTGASYPRMTFSDRHRRESTTSDLTQMTGGLSFGPPIPTTLAPIAPMLATPAMSPLPSPGLFSYATVSPMFATAPFGHYPLYGTVKLNDFQHPLADYQHTLQPTPMRSVQKQRNTDAEMFGPSNRSDQTVADRSAANRFANVNLENLVGEIYSLCKDQHGCRFLQKKLEERNPAYVQIIFMETNSHVVELMTDPFGNYLCQKLLEHADDEQRTVLVNNAAPELVKIALNQHGTRALQKMIEYITTPTQILTIVNALKSKVVELIQDLNGNHVVQKCLNRLSSSDAQFIYDAVGDNCVAVGTHRHGCCVLQRCIDHASPAQKTALIGKITNNAIALVQDPFGNYVVQYILDLGDPVYSEPVIKRFLGKVCLLSKQKFSSNVIEKCIRVSEPPTKKRLIEEMLDTSELERLLRDSFANYVIQTALESAEPTLRNQLVESIKPLLPAIKLTPYGRRIQSKIQVLTGNSNFPSMPNTNRYSASFALRGNPMFSGAGSYRQDNTTNNFFP